MDTNGYGKVGGPASVKANSISKDVELRGLLCVEGTLPGTPPSALCSVF